jgi:hypothetical protein
MSKCIYIEVADDGAVSVGMKPEGVEIPEGTEMQPAESLDAAFDMGREMLTANPEQDAENNAAFAEGFKGSAPELLNSRGL